MRKEFQCWIPEEMDQGDSHSVKAIDAEEAAKEFAQNDHDGSGECPAETKVNVADEHGVVTKFIVTWEATREYYAAEVE